jgi:hypothetical protein
MKIIIWPQDNGPIAVCIPSGEISLEEVIAKDVPKNVSYKVINVEDLPLQMGDEFFDAVRIENESIVVSLEAAKALVLVKINNNARIEARTRQENTNIGIPNTPDDQTWISNLNNKRSSVNSATTIEELRNI